MAGEIKRMIEEILAKRSNGNEMLIRLIRTKLILKGIDPEAFTDNSDDDPTIIEKLKKIAQD